MLCSKVRWYVIMRKVFYQFGCLIVENRIYLNYLEQKGFIKEYQVGDRIFGKFKEVELDVIQLRELFNYIVKLLSLNVIFVVFVVFYLVF